MDHGRWCLRAYLVAVRVPYLASDAWKSINDQFEPLVLAAASTYPTKARMFTEYSDLAIIPKTGRLMK